jgi:hypothetical protein
VTHQHAIVSAWDATSLRVAKRRHSRIQLESSGKHVLYYVGCDWLQVLVCSALGDDHDALALSQAALLHRKVKDTLSAFR